MTYAIARGSGTVASAESGWTPSSATVVGSSRATMPIRPAGRSSRICSVPTTNCARLSASMNAIRSVGSRPSIGRYAPPAFHTASIAVII